MAVWKKTIRSGPILIMQYNYIYNSAIIEQYNVAVGIIASSMMLWGYIYFIPWLVCLSQTCSFSEGKNKNPTICKHSSKCHHQVG